MTQDVERRLAYLEAQIEDTRLEMGAHPHAGPLAHPDLKGLVFEQNRQEERIDRALRWINAVVEIMVNRDDPEFEALFDEMCK